MCLLKPTQVTSPLFSTLLAPSAALFAASLASSSAPSFASPTAEPLAAVPDTSPVGEAMSRQLAHASEAAQRGSARRKLWDMANTAACPVTGVCLHYGDLYKLARKAGLPVKGSSEYEVHIQVVSECRRRSDMAQRIQRELDTRYARQLREVGTVKTTEELAHWWHQACQGADWAGVFWAVLTHPRCTPELEFIVLGQVHMLQHQVGMASRVDQHRFNEVLDENLRLGEELELTQQRWQAARSSHTQELGRLQAELMKLRAEVIRAQTERDQAQAQWQTLKTSEPDLLARQHLTDENASLLAHNRLLRRALDRAEQALGRQVAIAPAVESDVAATDATRTGSNLMCASARVALEDRAVLCVGGRTGGVPVYREVIEQTGARFMHHDGGDEERTAQLGSHLQAADVVICQVGCISHNAYWRVKEHCKRTGKPCLFVESSSRSALERALASVAATEGID